MISWIVALKKFNKGKDCWCIPKKGSSGYQEVLRLMKNPSAQSDKTPFWSKLAQRAPAVKKTRRGRFRDDDYDNVDVAGELAAVKEARAMGRSMYSLKGKSPFGTPSKTIKVVKKVAPHKGGPILFGRAPKTPPGKLLPVRRRSGVQSR